MNHFIHLLLTVLFPIGSGRHDTLTMHCVLLCHFPVPQPLPLPCPSSFATSLSLILCHFPVPQPLPLPCPSSFATSLSLILCHFPVPHPLPSRAAFAIHRQSSHLLCCLTVLSMYNLSEPLQSDLSQFTCYIIHIHLLSYRSTVSHLGVSSKCQGNR